METKNIFRQSSIESAASPEHFDEYVRVVKPKVWLTIVAILLLFCALLVWALMGSIRSTFPLQGVQEDDTFFAFIMPRDALTIQPGMEA